MVFKDGEWRCSCGLPFGYPDTLCEECRSRQIGSGPARFAEYIRGFDRALKRTALDVIAEEPGYRCGVCGKPYHDPLCPKCGGEMTREKDGTWRCGCGVTKQDTDMVCELCRKAHNGSAAFFAEYVRSLG